MPNDGRGTSESAEASSDETPYVARQVREPRLIVGIGASAGGLDACRRLLISMHDGGDMALVIVMHLDPSRESKLAEIYQLSTPMEVVQASGEQVLEPNRVYVIAPDRYLEVKRGTLYSRGRRRSPDQHKPVDTLLSSLAEDQGERAVGIILSGAGDNGSVGIQEIKRRGGLCLVQEPQTAQYDSMPRNTMATGAADHVVPPEEMPRLLLEYAARLDDKAPAEHDPRDQASDAFGHILDLLGRTYGVDFRHSYKKGTLERRTERRMGLLRLSEWQAYLDVLHDDPDELSSLYRDLLIGVTEFFRDPEVWSHLETEVLPGFLAQHEDDLPIKIWVPGCATGEEAYTLAIVCLQQLERLGRTDQVQIFASDVAENALVFARRGLYPSTIVDHVAPERLSRFFRRDGDKFRISQDVRDCVTFAVHNLLADPPFAKLDMVSCRNLLIYLDASAHQRVLELFHFALKPGGFLLLGASETVGRHGNIFETVSHAARIYRASTTSETARYNLMLWKGARTPARGVPSRQMSPPKGLQINRAIEQIVLARYTWACVVVTEAFEIQSFFGPTHDYLLQPTGEVRMDLLAWVRPGLYPRLRAALQRAVEHKERVTITDRVERSGKPQRVECTVDPIAPIAGGTRMLLISFRDLPSEPAERIRGAEAVAADSEDPLVHQLEAEVKHARTELQGTVEQLENTEEEYRASHEELLSLNEELQSNNEELEASKEELQSLNEEMTTINRQLETRNVELRTATNDISNLLVSTGIPIIFLDRELRVRRFTPAATELMHLIPADVGRSVEDIRGRFRDGDLIRDAHRVLDKLVPISAVVETDDGRSFARNVLPYRTEDDRIDGVSIAFFDITEQYEAAREHEDARRSAEAIVAASPAALLTLDSDLRVVAANDAFCEAFQMTKSETEGSLLYDLGDRQWDIPQLQTLLEQILSQKETIRDFEVLHEFEHLGPRTMSLHARRMSRGDKPPLILLQIEDVTRRKSAEQLLQARAESLAREHQRQNEFMALLGQALRNPLSALLHGIDLLKLAPDDPAQLEHIREMMTRQAHRIGSMIDQVLEIARVTAGKIPITWTTVDLAEPVQAAIDAVTPLLESRAHELIVSMPLPHSTVVQGDPLQLAQVVENLLNNAGKYTQEGGKIELTLEADGPHARLRVRDNGIGMDPDLVPRIFELFTHGPRTLDPSAGGLGLGLPLVKRVVEMHGGAVEASSPGRGSGSEFVVTLPRVQDGQQSLPRPQGEPPEAALDPPRPRRILVVDDEQDAALMISEILALSGHEARAVHDGPAALEVLRTFRPEVVLLDLGLPRMDGYEVASRIRKEYGHDDVLLVALTGYQRDDERLEHAGFDRYLMKPADMQELFAWLEARDREPR